MTRNPMRKPHAEEDGWILVTAISLMAVMLVVAFASMALVDTQQKRAMEQRERESSLNLAEGVLYAQGFQLARRWPGTSATAVTNDCVSSTYSAVCPTATQVQQNADNVDTLADTTWTAAVRDNGGPHLTTAFQPEYMNAAQSGTNATGQSYSCAAPCRWDANGDRKVWVTANSVVRGEPRSVVATLKLEKIAESTPRAAVTAGGINTNNSGNQVKIYAVGSNVVVRCSPSSSACVSGSGVTPAPQQGNPGNLMTPSQIQRFKARAEADGTYYNGCSQIPQAGGGLNLAGQVVFVDNCSTTANVGMFTCTQPLPPKPAGAGNGLSAPCINAIASPGLVIWHCGKLELSGNGNGTYIGLMYFANNSDGTCSSAYPPIGGSSPNCSGNKNNANNVFITNGGFGIWGAIAIDGNGCLFAGANGMNVQYDANAFNAVASYGTVGLVQDTWRELKPLQ